LTLPESRNRTSSDSQLLADFGADVRGKRESKPAPFDKANLKGMRHPRISQRAKGVPPAYNLCEAIKASAEEFVKAEIAEDLELLADFVADVEILRMQSCQRIGVSVDIGESEFEFA
jgi:hypothetical protein